MEKWLFRREEVSTIVAWKRERVNGGGGGGGGVKAVDFVESGKKFVGRPGRRNFFITVITTEGVILNSKGRVIFLSSKITRMF